MKAEIRHEGILAQENGRGSASTAQEPARGRWSYGRQLRALGQAVEKFRLSAFELEHNCGSYKVMGNAAPIPNSRFSVSRLLWKLFSQNFSAGRHSVPKVVLWFSAEEIERFDLHGQSRRQDSGQTPDPYHLSQILRAAGTVLDHKKAADLVGISLRGEWVIINYQTAAGQLAQVRENLRGYYDFWVKLYLRRRNRPKGPAPSKPTFHVSWTDDRRT